MYPQLAVPSQQRTGYSVDGMPVPVEYFWLRVESSFQSSFGLLQMTASASRGSYLGSRYSYRDGQRDLRHLSRGEALRWQRETRGEITEQRYWLTDNNSWSFATMLIPLQQQLIGGPHNNFNAAELTILGEVAARIDKSDCKKWINKKLAEFKKAGKIKDDRDTLDKLLAIARFNKWNEGDEDKYSPQDLGI